jgi:predicted ferric reductase
MGLLIVGVAVYVYKVILYKFIGPRLEYAISQINLRGAITEIILKPISTTINYEPGQFAFVVFNNPVVGLEEHPFSLSSSPSNELVRLSIKKSGDFTSTLPSLKKGDQVLIYGPYGQFGRRVFATNKQVLMIAGGIGITPFLSIVNYIKDKNLKINYKLMYTYKNDSDSAYKEELVALCGDRLVTHHSDKMGHLTADIVRKNTGELTNKLILLCGPRRMMIDLTNQFLRLGVKRQNIIFEDFDLKG